MSVVVVAIRFESFSGSLIQNLIQTQNCVKFMAGQAAAEHTLCALPGNGRAETSSCIFKQAALPTTTTTTTTREQPNLCYTTWVQHVLE